MIDGNAKVRVHVIQIMSEDILVALTQLMDINVGVAHRLMGPDAARCLNTIRHLKMEAEKIMNEQARKAHAPGSYLELLKD